MEPRFTRYDSLWNKIKKVCRNISGVSGKFIKKWLAYCIEKKTPAKTNEFFDVIHKSNRKLSLFETDVGKEVVDKVFTVFLISKDFQKYRSYIFKKEKTLLKRLIAQNVIYQKASLLKRLCIMDWWTTKGN